MISGSNLGESPFLVQNLKKKALIVRKKHFTCTLGNKKVQQQLDPVTLGLFLHKVYFLC